MGREAPGTPGRARQALYVGGALVASEGAGEPPSHHGSVWKCRCPGHPLRQPHEVELSVSVQGTVVFVFFRNCLHTKFWPSLVLKVGRPSRVGSEGLGRGTPRGSRKYGLP